MIDFRAGRPATRSPNDRMLKFRARGFAGHDAFPDVLRGIRTAEEVVDMGLETIEVEPVKEVRRISQTVPPPVSADSPAAAVPAPATAENTDVL